MSPVVFKFLLPPINLFVDVVLLDNTYSFVPPKKMRYCIVVDPPVPKNQSA